MSAFTQPVKCRTQPFKFIAQAILNIGESFDDFGGNRMPHEVLHALSVRPNGVALDHCSAERRPL